jgi:hypothetical protein
MIHTIDTPTPHKGRDYWYNHIKAWEDDGGTQSNYCRQHKLSERLFSLWKNKFIKEQSPALETPVDFVPLRKKEAIQPAVSNGSVAIAAITLPNGIRLDVPLTSSGADIAELAKHLVPLSC